MSGVYLHNWAKDEFFGVVMSFAGIYLDAEEFALDPEQSRDSSYLRRRQDEAVKALESPQYKGIDVLLASYSEDNYSGDAFVLFRRDGQLFEVNASHCSCYGLEGQWEPEETTVAALRHRLTKGTLGRDEWTGNEFAEELAAVLDALEGVE